MTRRKAEPRHLAIAFAAWAALAQAQEGPGTAGRGLTVTPRLSLMQSWTDNLQLAAENKDAALVTTVSPGLTLTSNNPALRGSLDYSLNGIAYIKSDQPSQVQNSLTADARAELISQTLFVDMRASIGQQSTSAFGLQSVPTAGSQGGAASSLANANQRETMSLAVSPALRGFLGSRASYELRGDFTQTEVRRSSLGDSRGNGFSLRVDQASAGTLGWWFLATTRAFKSESAASNRETSLRLGLNYRPDPDWTFTANAGRERSNYLGAGQATGTTAGASAEWTPTVRTRLGADWQRHDYGSSHALTAEHRLQRVALRYTDSQSTMLGNTGGNGGVRTNYDLLFLLYASREPDPVKRDLLVRSELQRLGLSPDAVASLGFLSAGPSRLRSQQLAVTLQGVRATLTAQMSRSLSTRLGSNQNGGDLANSSRVEQRSYSLSAGYQLSPTSGLSLVGARQETRGDTASQSTALTSWFANWTARLSSRLSTQLGVRHSQYEGSTAYTENAAFASLTQQF